MSSSSLLPAAPPAPLRCLLVDDEPLAHTVLRAYLDRLPGLAAWAGSCYGAVEALTFLRATPVDVLFLDVDMPELTGLELLRALPQPPAVVLCTAHAAHALDAFELGVVDYLLKPIRFERFVKTIGRLQAGAAPPAPLPLAPDPPPPAPADSIFIKTDAGTERVRFAELLVVEGYGNFVKCHLASGRVLLTAETMKQMESELPALHFVRTHKSYLVNITRVDRLSGNCLHVGSREVPVGSTYRHGVLASLKLR
ncbi:LytR/AlgR family response regulator transcription factor [Hymenobacter weizhouensis]|uniref:LytR/AlgR family response regulator transcription factor n=1 Tax=Hymenobacter sp. YIM 151500-1 TaxID=2987689 RepID=UPI00222773D5|nr:LytTR family DNA-binding domain-containing protein [Hymenobacter sp. YIM 151500-1]UYZ61645.1 LytTR family DNA-binding domain-containing protein [Hymenobacter sp. YIM 151500-1]